MKKIIPFYSYPLRSYSGFRASKHRLYLCQFGDDGGWTEKHDEGRRYLERRLEVKSRLHS